ncbi:MAG: DUF433 domain-containing protein [Ignavibacteriae bacterium]|nr:DUF433 domain-containing protein [Ignavibacteriota bacterium]
MSRKVRERSDAMFQKGAITIDPETMGGTPVFTGTRVPIQSLFDYLEGGYALEVFLENFPSVSKEKALEVLNTAEGFVTNKKLLDENPA